MSTIGKTIKCKAAVTWSPRHQTIEEIEVEAPHGGEVRIKVIASGICGSDNHILNADQDRSASIRWPTILGHEGEYIIK
jgi:Zn-dependent alcohol dehydrogenase